MPRRYAGFVCDKIALPGLTIKQDAALRSIQALNAVFVR
jgi:hypothetical protein